jgi:hypothetical protein
MTPNIEVKSLAIQDYNLEFLALLAVYNLIDRVMESELQDVPLEVLDDLIRRLKPQK